MNRVSEDWKCRTRTTNFTIKLDISRPRLVTIRPRPVRFSGRHRAIMFELTGMQRCGDDPLVSITSGKLRSNNDVSLQLLLGLRTGMEVFGSRICSDCTSPEVSLSAEQAHL